jgi:hypothetical protein
MLAPPRRGDGSAQAGVDPHARPTRKRGETVKSDSGMERLRAKCAGTAGWTRTTDLLIHSQAL